MKEFIEWLIIHPEVTVEFKGLIDFGNDQVVHISMYYIDVVTRQKYCGSRFIDKDLVHYIDYDQDNITKILDNLYEKLKERVNEEI